MIDIICYLIWSIDQAKLVGSDTTYENEYVGDLLSVTQWDRDLSIMSIFIVLWN